MSYGTSFWYNYKRCCYVMYIHLAWAQMRNCIALRDVNKKIIFP